ncbi:MAG TPA: AraC family transcriptional regulator [Puia sp.]|jgi:AraC-like DNA-binding protein
MDTSTEKRPIPVYSLLENSLTGNPLIEVVRVTAGDISVAEPAFLIPHRKNYYLFALVKKGSSRHWVDSLPYTLQPDTFYFTTPQQVHLKEERKPVQGWFVRFTQEFLQLEENRGLMALPVIRNPAEAHALPLSPQEMMTAEDILEKMLAEFQADGSWKNQMLTAQLRILVIHMSRIYTAQYGEQTAPCRSMLQQFQILIDQHHPEWHDVASYARVLHLTPDYLNDLVKRQSGRTAMAHIHQRLLAEAKRRLLYTEASVKELADQLGFADDAYFNRWFRRLSEETPLTYRVKIREMYR